MSLSRIIKLLYLALFFFTPLIFTSVNSELFEIPKMYLIYGLTTIIISLHFINHFRHGAPLYRHTVFALPLIPFFTSQLISTFFSVDIHTSVFGYYSRLNGGLLSLVAFMSLYFILINYLTAKFKENLITIFLISGFLVAVYGILQHFGIDKSLWIQDVQARVFSTLGQPNWLAALMAILIPFALFRLLTSKSTYGQGIALSLNLIFYLCLLFTKSKSGIIATVVSLGLFFFIYLIKSKSRNLKLLITNYSLLIILSLFITNPIRDYIFHPNSPTTSHIPSTTSQLLITPSEDIRKIVWQGAYNLWQQFPLLGTGPETFAYTYYWTRPLSHNLTSEWDYLYNKAHNEYLNYLATTGIFGLSTYLFFIFIVLFFCFKSLSAKCYLLNAAILCSFISILITNIAGFSVATTSLFFFLLPALLIPNPISLPAKVSTSAGYIPNPKSHFSFLGTGLTVIFAFFALRFVLFYFLADITYANAQKLDKKQNYSAALEQIELSLNYHPQEPVYISEYATILSKFAITADKSKYDVDKLMATAADASTRAIKSSPVNVNLWKERAQIYYYLSLVDKNYLTSSIESLNHVAKLAPTDAKTFYLIGKFSDSGSYSDQAKAAYLEALRLKPNYDHASYALALVYFNEKNYSEAEKFFNLTLQIAPANTQAKDYLQKISTSLP